MFSKMQAEAVKQEDKGYSIDIYFNSQETDKTSVKCINIDVDIVNSLY